MKFFLPVGGIVDDRFGILTNYNHKAAPIGIVKGMDWAGDVPTYGKKGFGPGEWLQWIKLVQPYHSTCLFMVCPDVPFDAKLTIIWYNTFRPKLNGWPVAFVAQDGQEDLPFPEKFSTLFIGGSTRWKESQAAIDCIKRAQAEGKHIHIGRVNWGRRYKMFKILEGSEGFTCDGTRTRFDGTKKTAAAWAGYMAQTPLFTIANAGVFIRHHSG